jgi:propanol-preferring alcohol dehydrogenase
MILKAPKQPLEEADLPKPEQRSGQLLIRVHACGICRTDLHIVDGELTDPELPVIPGHQIVGTVVETGSNVGAFSVGDRVGMPWLGWSCGQCEFCRTGRENLCDKARYTGYQINGGFAEFCVADARFCFPIPGGYPDLQAAPLLCAGLIGYRAYRMTGEARRIGFYGFGAAAHILIQVAIHEGREVHAITRPGDNDGMDFARDLGATWAGTSDEVPPGSLDAAIIFAPAGELVPMALKAVVKGGTVVCAGIHMSDIPSFPYSILWGERIVRSVANLTRKDGEDFMALAPKVPVKTKVNTYTLSQANKALDDLRQGKFVGAGVIVIDE